MAHLYINSSLWYKEKINDPMKVISAAFDFAEIEVYRKTLKHLLLFAEIKQPYNKKEPGYFLQNLEKIEAMINAAFIINKENLKSITRRPSFSKIDIDSQINSLNWNTFPRSLSFKEYNNPEAVISKFFKYQKLSDWKHCLKSILDLTLTSDNIHESMLEINAFSTFLQLTKLIESVHLIHVYSKVKDKQ